jgi:uncharacterized membrane protein
MQVTRRKFIDHVLSREDRDAISSAIHRVELSTSGEIKVVVRERRHLGEKRLTLERIAIREFHHLKLSKTKDRTGILFFLLLSERKFHIIADEGIHRKVPEGTWDRVAISMGEDFKKRKYREGIVQGIDLVGRILSEEFPRSTGDQNEVSDNVVVE